MLSVDLMICSGRPAIIVRTAAVPGPAGVEDNVLIAVHGQALAVSAGPAAMRVMNEVRVGAWLPSRPGLPAGAPSRTAQSDRSRLRESGPLRCTLLAC